MFYVMLSPVSFFIFFFFNDTATTEIYTLSLHDALPISVRKFIVRRARAARDQRLLLGEFREIDPARCAFDRVSLLMRSEEHTSELQSQSNLVCRLLLEKKKKKTIHKSRHKVSACI